LRGKVDTNRESGTNELRDQVLRGAGQSVWGALAMTFIDDNGKRFVAARIYTVAPGATASRDVVTRMVTVEARLDLRELESLRESGFDKFSLERRFPAMTVHKTYDRFSQRLFDRLGIGANGDGAKALRLLARIQGGQHIPSVDGLYKQMVLEKPATYAAADDDVDDFRVVEETYEQMVTAAEKARLLSRLPELWDERNEALENEKLIDTFGVTRDGPTPLLHWHFTTEAALLETAVEANKVEREQVNTRLRDAEARQRQLKIDIDKTRRDQAANGGDRLDRLKLELQQLAEDLTVTESKRTAFDTRVALLNLNVSSEEDLFTAQLEAETFFSSFTDREAALEADRTALFEQGSPLTARRTDTITELDSLRQRKSLIPTGLHDARTTMAAAAGLDESDLPFVAELIDIDANQQDWRHAAEVAWHSIVRVMLVGARHHEQLSRAIDSIRMRRINFTGVDLVEYLERHGTDGYLSGKLIFKDSPFSGWVRDRLTQPGTDALCVSSTDQLAGPQQRITRSGQTRRGRDSAHGDYNSKPIIGFNNADLITSYETELADVDEQITNLRLRVTALETELRDLRAAAAAHQLVLDTAWETIDAASVEADITSHENDITRILETSDILAELARTLTELEKQLGEVDADLVRAGDRRNELNEAHATMCTRQDTIVTTLDDYAERGVTLTDAQAEHLNVVYASVADPTSLSGLPDGFKRLRSRLADNSRTERERAKKATDSLISIFEQYQAREAWYDPNRGTTIADYQAYRDELDQVTYDRLHEIREEWRQRLIKWTGERLVPLHGAFDSSIEDIEERLEPVNDILTSLPFGPQRDSLRIVLRRLNPADVIDFRRELKALSSGVTGDLTDDQAEARFRRLRNLTTHIRVSEPGSKTTNNRDAFLDVRKHVEITAVRLDAVGHQVATYAWLGDKSGGETQELVAFIVGAALRFQLGDEDRARPRFAPIFLDEGFVKSDSEFAGRAVGAWKGLGFQLIIGAPLDKVTALEPAMELLLSVTKGPKGYSHINEIRPADEPTP
jgi:uncharacterized protein YPO0396